MCREDRKIIDPDSSRAAELPYLGLEHVEGVTGRVLPTGADGAGRSTTFAFDPRHVLYGKLRPYLNKVALPEFAGRCTTELIPLLPAAGVDRGYLAWLLRRPATVEAAMRHKTGARMPRADLHHVFSLVVEVPGGLEEQHAIVARLNQQMRWVAGAKDACRRQDELLDRIAHRLLAEFPGGSRRRGEIA